MIIAYQTNQYTGTMATWWPEEVKMAKHGKHKLTKMKAKEILRHGEVKGHKLTAKQKGFFGARAGGAPIRRKK